MGNVAGHAAIGDLPRGRWRTEAGVQDQPATGEISSVAPGDAELVSVEAHALEFYSFTHGAAFDTSAPMAV